MCYLLRSGEMLEDWRSSSSARGRKVGLVEREKLREEDGLRADGVGQVE